MNNFQALMECHVGGITEVVTVPRDLMAELIQRLTTCHDHVFVLDGSRHFTVSFGVSIRGKTCIEDHMTRRSTNSDQSEHPFDMT